MPVASWYRRQAEQGRVLHYGAATNWAFARIGAMTGSNEESSLEAFGRAMRDRRWVENVATETEVAGVLARLERGLNEGGIGIGILNAYAPGAGVQELTAVCELAAAHNVPTFTHVAYMARVDPESAAEAYVRLIGYAGATGAHMHICHFNSSSKTDIERCARLVAKAQAQGLPITVEAYPYGTGSTVLAATFFNDPNFEARQGTGYDAVQRVTDGHRFSSLEEVVKGQEEDPSALVLWHFLDTENNASHRDMLDMSVMFPGGAIASDAMPWSLSDGSVYTGDAWPLPGDATAHPRSAGTFTRFIRQWVREREAVSLLEGVCKCALIPAQILEASTPAMAAKGRLAPGADGDVVVFDLATLTDRSEFSAMNRPSEGVRHLLVGGTPLIADGELIAGASDGVVSLANGCICCTLEGDLLRTLAGLLRRVPRPERIVIETSGVAEPAEIVRNLMDPVVWRAAPLETMLCVLDASMPAEAQEDALLRGQLRAADLVALSKTDLATAEDVARTRALAAAVAPRAAVVEAVQGAVEATLLFPDLPEGPQSRAVERARPAATRFDSLAWTSERPVSLKRLQAAIARLAPRLARAKGLLEAVERPGQQMLLQLAGGRAVLAPTGQARPAGLPAVRLVFIAEIGRLSAGEVEAVMKEAVVAAGR